MLGQLISPLTKGLLLVAFLATSVASLTTYLYLDKRDELASLKSTYTQLKQDYTECSEGKEKLKISAEQDDKINLDKQLKLDSLTAEKDTLLGQLNKIPKKSCKAATQPQNNIDGKPDEIQYVDIDAPFPPEYKRVFEQLGKKDRGSSNTSN